VDAAKCIQPAAGDARSLPRGEIRGASWLLAAALLALLLGGAGPARAGAAIYTYVDAQGITHFTNAPTDGRFTRMPDPEPARRARRRAPEYFGYDGMIGLAARQHEVPPALVKAVMAAESGFDAEAVSHKGAIGLMQLMPFTADALGVDPTEPLENVDGGTRYLREMLDRYGDLPRALAAYNAGPRAVDRFGGVPPYRETRAYVERVLTYYREYHGDFRR
jgi:soluble lytic murein transglycosylase-like protein